MTKSRSNATAPNAKGTLVVGNGTDASTTLAVASTAGYVLTVDSAEATGLKWAAVAAPSFVGVSCYSNASQTIANATETYLNFQVEEFDTDAYHDNSTNNTRITIPTGKGGKYLIVVQIRWATNTAGVRYAFLNKNGTVYATDGVTQAPITGENVAQCFSYVSSANAGDYFQVAAYQTSGGNLVVNGGQSYTRFSATYLGA